MGDVVNYWKIPKEHIINRRNMGYIWSYIGNCWTMNEVRNKAKELYEQYKNEWEGILLRIIRVNAWDEPTNIYYLYYNGKKFVKDPDYIFFDNTDIDNYMKEINNKID